MEPDLNEVDIHCIKHYGYNTVGDVNKLRAKQDKDHLIIEEFEYRNAMLEEQIERYKRIASQKLDDIEEFRKNECEHRCIKNAEIEELKNKNKGYDTAYNLGKAYSSKMWEDKIKAKIEELDEEIKVKREIAKNPMDRVSGRLLTDSIVELEKTKKFCNHF